MDIIKVIEARILAQVNQLSIVDVITTKPDFRNSYSARFSPVQVGEVKDYTGSVEWDKAVVKPIDLTLNQKKYFAFSVDSIEKLKTKPEQIDKQARNQARKIANAETTFLLDLLAKAAGKTVTAAVDTPDQTYDCIVDANKELSKLEAPLNDRFAIIDYDSLGRLEKDARFTKYEKILSNGVIEGSSINGVTLIVTNSLPKDTFLLVQKEGVGFERFLDELETMRLQTSFADGIRGLDVFDGTALNKECIVKVNTKVSAGGTK